MQKIKPFKLFEDVQQKRKKVELCSFSDELSSHLYCLQINRNQRVFKLNTE